MSGHAVVKFMINKKLRDNVSFFSDAIIGMHTPSVYYITNKPVSFYSQYLDTQKHSSNKGVSKD